MKKAAVVALLILTGCTAPAVQGPASDLALEYRLNAAGVGGTPVPGVVNVPQGQAATFVAMVAVQRSLEPYRAAIAQPDLLSLNDAVKDVAWSSDTGYIPPELLTQYNARNPPRALRGRVFGIRFEGRVLLVESEMRYRIGAKVMQRGGGEAWQPLGEQDFDGGFFVADLVSRVRSNLTQPAP